MINDTVVSLAKQELRGMNVSVGSAIQPVTTAHLTAARESGGDALDLDPEDGSFISKSHSFLISELIRSPGFLVSEILMSSCFSCLDLFQLGRPCIGFSC